MREVPEWIGRTDNTPAPDRVKERIARKADDTCPKCTRKIGGKLRAEYDHIIPLILGGENREANLQLLCNECHAGKTKLDVKIKSKVARVRKHVLGIRKPSRLQSRGFEKSPAQRTASRPIVRQF